MKALILGSIFALSVLMVSAAYPKPNTIFSDNRGGKFSLKELELMANSAVYQRAAVTHIFRQADANKSGNLDLDELRTAYGYLMFNAFEYMDVDLIQNEFNQGDFIKNQIISIDELAFLFNRWFKFMNNNPAVFSDLGDPDKQYEAIYDAAYKLEYELPYSVDIYDFPEIFPKFNPDGNSIITFDEFKSGLQGLVDLTGLNFASDDYTMRDTYELLLSPCDTVVSEDRLRNYMVPFLQNYLYHVKFRLPHVEPNYEEEQGEEEYNGN